jgi:hypothetical protein
MGSHPINLAIRFLLEVVALTSMGMWGWRASDGWTLASVIVLPESCQDEGSW